VFMWADDPLYQPTDDEYVKADLKTGLSINPMGNLATTWGKMKNEN